ncbi:MAG: YifB family Mg chelatase-like AAA ATPase, partial [Pseudomonadota bacterium]|nr:YifB family Mg chelatase-like AAA ATPase [Pseudomonadota bacterium]
MSLARVFTRAQIGIEAPSVTVETHLTAGLPGFSVVGLPEASVRESKDRVRSAIINAGFEFPMRRITINLAPADLPKEGGRFDLPIALSILKASGQLQAELDNHEFIGELALSGELRSVRGALPSAKAAEQSGRPMVLPFENQQEVQLLEDSGAKLAKTLLDVTACLNALQAWQTPQAFSSDDKDMTSLAPMVDLADIKDQFLAKRCLEIAASGGHSLLFCGPPGSGKTLLAKAFTSILPPLSDQEIMENACVFSVQNKVDFEISYQRPFRQPHHSSSAVALIGGGAKPQPGEISLAHNGVLFLDELPEFERRVLDMLREPMEAKEVHISRAAYQVTFPSKFTLISAMNPCPCGYLGDPEKSCGYTCN